MKNELPNYNKKVGGYVVFNKDGKTAITNDGTKGGYFYGDSHQDPSNGISAIVDNDRPILVEGNEVIINKKTVASEKILTIKGTPKEILSTLNQMDGNGVAIGDEEAEILSKYRTGGRIGEPQNKEIERLKNLPYSKFLLEVLDSYKELNAEVGVKGYHQNSGEPIIGYFPNQYEYMYRSDSTGKPIRFFIDLGNEKYIHPFDINPKFNPTEQKRIEQKADYFVKGGNENYEKSIKELKDNNELDIVVETLKKALKTFNIENQYDSSDIFKSSGNSILESKDEVKRRLKFDIYYFRVNDSELKSNIKNLDLERFKDEYLAKYRTGGEIPREKQMYLGKEGGSNVSPKGMFESAVQMENEGIDSETIRSITGWFRSDLDGLWRYEISDNEMEIICTFTDKEINHLKTKNNYIQRHLKDVIKHEELFKAYPRIKYLKVLFVDSNNSDVALLDVSNEGVMFIICNLKYEREISDNRGGTKELGEREISDNRRSGEERKAKRYNTLHFRKVITHELQHAIQINEGLAEGGNPNIELKKLKTNSGAIQSLTEKEQEYIATQRYLNKAGEIEAMSSDVRIDYNDLQRRRNKPYSEIAIDKKYFSSDLETKIKFVEGGRIPREKQIYLGKEGGSNVSSKGMFEEAVDMENEGIDSETIRSITGWFRNPFDKLWRFEISDREAKINLSKIVSTIKKVVSSKSEVTLSLKDVYTNNELSKAYGKSIEELPFMFYYDDENEGLGRLNIIPLAGKVFIKLNVYEFLRGNVGEVESTVAERGKLFISFTTHELQHAIQIREGLSAGGSVEQEYRKLLKEHKGVSERKDRAENNRKTREDVLLEQARLNYLNHLGEIEASDSDVRKFFDKKTRIEIPPYSLINFNNEEVIVVPEIKIKFKEGGELIKRADGSYSRRGLWDNIRYNVGSGRKPTKQMLEREFKIRDKYHLGGDMSKHLAPNGKPSNLTHEQWHLVRTPEFKAWFGDWENNPETASKVVDENGEPLVCYHGTEKEFTVFDLKKIGEWSGNLGHYGYGFYFSDDIKEAKGYGSKILNCFLNIKKPFLGTYYEFDLLKDNGFTGIDDKVALSIDFKDLHNKMKSIDMNAYNFMSIAEKNGLDNVWNLYLNSKESNEEGKVDLNDLYDILSFTDLAKENNSVPDFIVEYIESIGIEPKLNMGYENPQSLHWVTDLGNNSKEFTDFIKTLNYDGVIYGSECVALNSNQIKLADGTNTTFNANNDDIRFAEGGSISNMTPSELKEFYDSPEGKKLDAQTYAEWKRLVNMTKSELEKFYNSVEGKEAGLTTSQAKEQGIDSGRESARWIIKMKDIPYKEWSSDMWRWAKKQISFIKRMTGMRGKLYNDKGEKTRKHTALLIWGHNPEEKFARGGGIGDEKIKLLEDIGVDRSLLKEDEKSEKVFLGNMRASNGDNLELYAEEINLSYGSYKKFVRKITASNEKGNVVFSFWNKPDEIVILHLESSSSPYYHKLLKDKPSENILKEKLGYGTDLVNKLIDESKSLGKEKIIADDVRSLNAEKYWERLGFVIEDDNVGERVLYLDNKKFKGGGDIKGYDNFKNPILINGFISNKEIDGKEIFLITYNSGGQEGLNVHQTMNPLAMLDAVEKKTGLHTNTLQVFIYEHTENSNRIETEDELEFLKDNYTVIIVDRDSVEFYNGHNPEQKFAEGGGIGDEVELELYQVRFDTDDDSEIKLVTTDFEDAKYRYDSTTIGDFGDSEFNVSLEKKIDKYKFIYELDEDESIEDYPVEEYYDDSYYYELTEEGEFENIENRVVTAFNSSSEDLLNDVENWAKNKFGNYKYNRIDVYSEDDENEENEPIGSIQLRISNHSQNEDNLPYGIDESLSVVIANKDATRGRFQQNRPQRYFSGDDSFDYVISEIENYIEDAKEQIQSKKFEKGGRLRKFKGGGELSQKALAVETNDLTDFVRKYFIKDGRIDVADAMQELFGNRRGKSIADEYRKRIGLHKKGGLTISQLAHNLWEQHRDEVREGIDDSDFRNAVEEVLISEYGVSSMIKSLMEKSEGNEQDRENEYWMNQFDEGDDEYYEDLSDGEVADYFRDMEGFESELAKGTEHEITTDDILNFLNTKLSKKHI